MKTMLTYSSLVLNLILAGLLLWGIALRREVPPPSTATRSAPETTMAPPPPPPPPLAIPPFHWSQIESSDYLAYIGNLRAIGCPEETIRDIIVADVNKLFSPRYAALTADAPELAWWGRYDGGKPLRVELAAQLRALHEEKKALLVRLLGSSPEVENALVEENVLRVRENNAYAFLPASKQTAVRNLISRYEALMEWNEPQWRGLSDEDALAQKQELIAARDRDLAALLTPEELKEYELRFSARAESLRTEFGRGNLTEAEYRELYRLYEEFQSQTPILNMEDVKRLEAQYAASLGAERFTDLEMQNDAMCRALEGFGPDTGVSSEALGQAYAIKQAYQEQMALAIGPLLEDPRQDPTPLRDLAAQMEAELSDLLGVHIVRQLDGLGVLPRLVVEDDGKRRMYSFSRSNALK